MDEMDLINILESLVDDEFKKFKWYLKSEKVDDIEPIKVNQLSKAEREDAVDLMVQKYQLEGAAEVMKSVLKKLSRNDLLRKMEPGPAAGSGPGCGPGSGPAPSSAPAGKNKADEKLKTVRTKFIDMVSDANIQKLLDHLLEGSTISEGEMEEMSQTGSRAGKARAVIDTVRRKGPTASSALISALCLVDPCLSKELNLM